MPPSKASTRRSSIAEAPLDNTHRNIRHLANYWKHRSTWDNKWENVHNKTRAGIAAKRRGKRAKIGRAERERPARFSRHSARSGPSTLPGARAIEGVDR